MELVLHGDSNADAEFSVEPSFSGAYGFGITVSDGDSSLLTIRRIGNWLETERMLEQKYPDIGFTLEESSTITEEEEERALNHNQAMYARRAAERTSHYMTDTLSVRISRRFARLVRDTFRTTIGGFRGHGRPAAILDGETVTLRCVADDEVWSLSVHSPVGGTAAIADICKGLIGDASAGNTIDEQKYTRLLTDTHL